MSKIIQLNVPEDVDGFALLNQKRLDAKEELQGGMSPREIHKQ